jgi:hypothetical protein
MYLKEESGYNKGTWTAMFIAALFTLTKLWKQTRCPSTDEWILRNVAFIYSGILFIPKKNKILSFARKWMEVENTARLRRPKATCFLSYVEYRPNTKEVQVNMVDMVDMFSI